MNIPLFREVMILRDEAARLLGYPNHAAFRIEEKMAKTPETVEEFLKDLRVRLGLGGKQEMAHLLVQKKGDASARNVPFDGNYYLWDHEFYNCIMLEEEFQFFVFVFAVFFFLLSLVAGMLGIFEE